MDKALENACKGQSKSQGGMNVNELKILAKQRGYNGPIKRKELLDFLCKPVKIVKTVKPVKIVKPVIPSNIKAITPVIPEFLSNPHGYPDIADSMISTLDFESLYALSRTNKSWKSYINNNLTKLSHLLYPYQTEVPLRTKMQTIIRELGIVDIEMLSFTMKNDYSDVVEIKNRSNSKLFKYTLDPTGFKSEFWFQYGKLHRIDGPATSYLDENGHIYFEVWSQQGQYHRLDGPAVIEVYENGQKIKEDWYQHGKLYRLDGPAETKWYENGQKLSENWYHQGKPHRLDGPAHSKWYENGQKKSEIWYKLNQWHRLDGPALTEWYENGELIIEAWYRDDQIYSDD